LVTHFQGGQAGAEIGSVDSIRANNTQMQMLRRGERRLSQINEAPSCPPWAHGHPMQRLGGGGARDGSAGSAACIVAAVLEVLFDE